MKEMLPFLIPTAFPTLMVLVGILLNQRFVDRLDTRIDKLAGSIEARFSALDGRIDRMRDQHHNDMMIIMGRDNDLDARLSKLEGKRE